MTQPMKASSVPPKAEVSRSGIRVPLTPTGTSRPPRPSASAAPKPASAAQRSSSGPPPLPSFEVAGEAPEINAELVEMELGRKEGPDSSATIVLSQAAFEDAIASSALRDTPTPMLKGSAPARASARPPLPAIPARESQSRLTPPPLPVASSVPPLPTRGASSVHPQPTPAASPVQAQPTPAASPVQPQSTSAASPVQAQPTSVASSVHPQPPVVIASGRDEVRAMVRAAKEAVAELDHMVKQMAARLDDPSKWSLQQLAPAVQSVKPGPLPPPPVPPSPSLASLHADLVAPKTPWYGMLQNRRVVYAMALSFAAGFGALLVALFCAQSC
jgi:hypothetical protein